MRWILVSDALTNANWKPSVSAAPRRPSRSATRSVSLPGTTNLTAAPPSRTNSSRYSRLTTSSQSCGLMSMAGPLTSSGEGNPVVDLLFPLLRDDPHGAAGGSGARAGWEANDVAPLGRGHATAVQKIDVSGKFLPRVFPGLAGQKRQQIVDVQKLHHDALAEQVLPALCDDGGIARVQRL